MNTHDGAGHDEVADVARSPEDALGADSASELNALARSSIKLMMGRQALVLLLAFGCGIVLARTLTPAEFGLFAIVTFVVGASELLASFGVAPALIQRRDDLTEGDLRVAFTLQQVTTSVVFLVIFVVAPWVTDLFDGSSDVVWLVRAVAFSLYLASWRSMSTLQLERHLRYSPLAKIEVIESIAYYGVAVGLAVAGYGVWSLAWAVLARGVIGTAITYAIAPWPIAFALDRGVVRRIVGFGAPFQAQSVIKLATDWVAPVLVGRFSGTQAVGWLTWAQSNAQKPLQLVESVMRVSFPHFSRLQENRAEVQRLLDRYLTFLLVPAGLWFTTILIAGPLLVPLIYTEKWSPAVPSLILFSAAMIGDVVAWVLAVSVISVGLVGRVLRVSALHAILFLVTAFVFMPLVGFVGVAVAYLIARIATVPFLAFLLGSGILSQVLATLGRLCIPIGGAAALGGCLLLVPVEGIVQASMVTVSTVIVYVLVAWLAFVPSTRGWARKTTVRWAKAA